MRTRTSQTARRALAACAAGALLVLAAAAAPGGLTAEARALGKGIVDNRLETASVNAALVPQWVEDMGAGGDGLGARWTRILVRWATLQPSSASSWNAAYRAQLHTIVDQLHAQDVSVIMTMIDVPKWASKKALWKSPPKGYKKGVYQPFYAMDVKRSSVRGAFARVGQFLAREYPVVQHFEAWNEPNLGSCLYPQKTRADAKYGARTYLAMLRAFDTGVHRSDKKAKVIAGATAPRGGDDAYSTTPQAFAKFLRANGAARSCDGYSHHPYVPRGTRNTAPSAKPNNPRTAVTLGNLSELTRLFPTKPFYLTEYGYGTHDSRYFGCTVSDATQAKYLTQAYALAAKKKQVKVLLWFLVQDWSEKGTTRYDTYGAYTGLKDLTGEKKPAWKAFQRVK
jgi:hypothetical protein